MTHWSHIFGFDGFSWVFLWASRREAPKADYVEIPLAAEMTDDDIDRAIRMHEGGRKGRGESYTSKLKTILGKWEYHGKYTMGIAWVNFWNDIIMKIMKRYLLECGNCREMM